MEATATFPEETRPPVRDHLARPPSKVAFRGTAGPVRPAGTYTVDPTGESSSRMTVELDLKGHGIGKLFAILARRQAAKQVPVDHEKFKELLENGVVPEASN